MHLIRAEFVKETRRAATMRQRHFKQLDRPLTSLANSVSWLLNWDMLVNEAENAGQPFPEAEMNMWPFAVWV
jgi:hypothetical protein